MNENDLNEYFNQRWKSMVDLLSQARSIEFLIRISSEIIENQAFAKSRSWDEFQNSPLNVSRKDLEQHIKDIWGKEAKRISHIKQICDKLAHADYRGAKNRLDAWNRKFGLVSKLNNEPARIMSIDRVQHDDGEIGGIRYTVNSDRNNLTLEEYMVFESQGYVSACNEIFKIAQREIDKKVPNIAGKCAALIFSKGLRLGDRVQSI